jgi:hypothetical protein
MTDPMIFNTTATPTLQILTGKWEQGLAMLDYILDQPPIKPVFLAMVTGHRDFRIPHRSNSVPAGTYLLEAAVQLSTHTGLQI